MNNSIAGLDEAFVKLVTDENFGLNNYQFKSFYFWCAMKEKVCMNNLHSLEENQGKVKTQDFCCSSIASLMCFYSQDMSHALK